MKINWNFTVNILILVIAVLLIIIQHDCVKPFLKNLRRPDYKSSRQTDNNKSEQTNKEQIAESPVVVNSPVVKPAAEFQDIKFPDNFLFGTAYSDFQIAGINKKNVRKRDETLRNEIHRNRFNKKNQWRIYSSRMQSFSNVYRFSRTNRRSYSGTPCRFSY